MKSNRLSSNDVLYAQEYNALRSDTKAASFLEPHQQFGALALPTNPSNGQTITLTINGSNITLTAKISPANPGDFLIGATAAATAATIIAGLQNPSVTTSSFIGFSGSQLVNAQLIQYLGWALASGGTTITPYSLNNTTYAPLNSFTASTTVTGASWTAQTMQLHVEPGTYYVGTTRVLFLGGPTPTFTAPVSNPRIDLVTADSSGTISTVTGTESASPTAPSYPTNKLVLCEVYHAVGETALYDFDNQQSGQGYIYNDVRPFLEPAYISSLSQVASGLFIADPGSEVQGNILYFNGTGWVLLAPGTSGQFLQTQGASANPQWVSFPLGMKSGISSYSGATGTQQIAHGLGRVPIMVRITMLQGNTTYGTGLSSVGVSDQNGNNEGVAIVLNINSGYFASVTGYLIYSGSTGSGSPNAHYANCSSLDATNINLSWTKLNSGNGPTFLWEVIG